MRVSASAGIADVITAAVIGAAAMAACAMPGPSRA